ATFRGQLSKAMATRGFSPVAVATLADAQSAIRAHTPAFAVVDLHLGPDSGLEVIEALRQHSDATRVLVLTGYGDMPTAVAAVKLGAVDYIAKPADTDEIVQALTAADGQLPPAPANPICPEEAKRQHIERFLACNKGNITKTAHLLKMHRRTLQRILKRGPEPDETEDLATAPEPDNDTIIRRSA
ncbi:MAG: response regulator, partial [Pseudomonadota bacterium]